MNSEQLKDQILDKIKSGEIHMKPRSYFLALSALAVLGILILMIAAAAILSFVVFAMHQNGAWYATDFGPQGYWIFISSAPWTIMLLAVVFLVVLEYLFRNFAFAYRKPLVYSVLGIIGVVTAGTIFIGQTPLHRNLLRMAEQDTLPVVGPFYKIYGLNRNHNAFIGAISELENPNFYLVNRRGEKFYVIVTSTTLYPKGNDFENGDLVAVIGDEDDNTIQARGVKKLILPREEYLPPNNMMRMRVLVPQP